MTVNTSKGTGLGYTQKPLVALRLLARWLLLGTGVICSNLAEGGAWIRSHDDPEMVDRVKDLTSGPHEADLEIITIPGWYKDMGKTKPVDFTVDRWTILQIPIRPSSVGTITLTDSSPFSPPVIHANYFSTEHDRQLAIWGFKKSCGIAKGSKVFESWEVPKRADELSDDEILEFLKEAANTCYHPTGTAKIGAESDNGVVDTNLSVHGVQALRICDVSVMPRILSGHTCAPIIAIAEKFADMLKVEYGRVKHEERV
jgi:choline dehydrogenase